MILDRILAELDSRCEELASATRHYARKRDRRNAFASWYALLEARLTRDCIRRMVQRSERRAA